MLGPTKCAGIRGVVSLNFKYDQNQFGRISSVNQKDYMLSGYGVAEQKEAKQERNVS